jgi:hypothetical protein
MEELINAIKDILINRIDNYVNDRKKIKNTVFTDCGIVGSQALAKAIKTLL